MYDDRFVAEVKESLAAKLPHWGFSTRDQLDLLTVSENATYLVKSQGGRCILRVQRPGYHTVTEILSELHWVQALRRDGAVRVARPIPGRDGELVGQIRKGDDTLWVVAFEFLEGSEPAETNDLRHWFGILGELTAKLHIHSRTWTPPSTFTRRVWDFETTLGSRPHWGAWTDGVGLGGEQRAVIARAVDVIRDRLDRFGRPSTRFGLIHADLRLANLLIADGGLSVIDFDDCGYGWFMYDFGAAVSFHEHKPFIPDLQAAWVEGYRRIAPLDAESEAMLPVFVMLRRLILMAWLARHQDTPAWQLFGDGFTDATADMARDFLSCHGA
jgi:Ser/Thr protein kinase RdoA (MazF antagonist)